MMDKVDLLFLRACKSLKPYQRVRSVYKRFYMNKTLEDADSHIAFILAQLIESNKIRFSIVDIIDDLHPETRWRWALKDDAPYHKVVVSILISKIRHTAANEINGYISPTRFR